MEPVPIGPKLDAVDEPERTNFLVQNHGLVTDNPTSLDAQELNSHNK
jgi:hypothetical protein